MKNEEYFADRIAEQAEMNFKAQVAVHLSSSNSKEENVLWAMFLAHNKIDLSKNLYDQNKKTGEIMLWKEELEMLSNGDFEMFLYDKGIQFTPYGFHVQKVLRNKLKSVLKGKAKRVN